MPEANDRIHTLRQLSQHIDEAFETGAKTQGRQLLEDAIDAAQDIPAYREYFRGDAARYLARSNATPRTGA